MHHQKRSLTLWTIEIVKIINYQKQNIMPLPLIAAPLIGAGLDAVTGLLGNASTNRANKELAEYQYTKDLEMWNKSNEYNTPTAQMQRYKDAGLNPNLMYGQGNSGNVSTSTPKYQAPTMDNHVQTKFDMLPALQLYQDIQVKKAQVDNLREQTKNAVTDNITKGIQQAGMLTSNATSQFGLSQAKRLADTQFEAAKANTQNLLKDLDIKDSTIETQRSTRNLNTSTINTQQQTQKESRARTESVILENALNKMGIQKGDNMLFRMGGRLFNSLNKEEFGKNFKDFFKGW